jgi:hypothetical protein
VLRFRETNPSITRAVEENRIRRDRLTPPFNEREADGTWRAARVGALLDVDLAFAGRIEEFSYDPTKREAIITISGDLIDVRSGEVIVSVAESGRGRLGSDQEDVNIARIAAVAEVAQKVGAALRERLAPPCAATNPTARGASPRPQTRTRDRDAVRDYSGCGAGRLAVLECATRPIRRPDWGRGAVAPLPLCLLGEWRDSPEHLPERCRRRWRIADTGGRRSAHQSR